MLASESERQRAFLSAVLGRELLRAVVPPLRAAGIAVMPLKGIWLQAFVYGDARPRPITDVDLLVPEPSYDAARAVLASLGFRVQTGSRSETIFVHADHELPVDLHQRLFRPGAFRLPTAALFARATRSARAFGVELYMPDPLDAFAHLVGHHVKSRTRRDDPMRREDLRATAEAFELDPRTTARHLHAAGMARAARYLFAEQADAFSRALLAALPEDPVGERVAAWAGALAHDGTRSPWLGALPGFLLERSLPAALAAVALRALERAQGDSPKEQ
jgi:hypothetical protein